LCHAAGASTDRRAREEEGFGLFLLPNGWLGRCFIDAADDEATMEIPLGLFLLPQGRPRPRFSTTAPVSRSITPASAIRRSTNRVARHAEETLSKIWGMKVRWRRRPTVQELGFSLMKQWALIYKLPLVGLCKLKVQLTHKPTIFRQK
jgi:hypothetical protein